MRHRDGMSNSAEPEQSALGLHCLPRPCRSTLFARIAVLRVITIFYRYHGHNMAELLTCIVYLCIVIKLKKSSLSCSFSDLHNFGICTESCWVYLYFCKCSP